VTQEALARVGASWARVRGKGNPEAYVRTTMARLHISRWRRLRRERLTGEPPEVGYTDPGLGRVEGDSGLWRLLGGLPPRQRAVLVLRYYEQHSDAEIADILGVATVTVRTQAFRALAKLRESLPHNGFAGPCWHLRFG